jgi:LDH2 family malate/lactate/ureidoglycolate dehydrogenase
MARYGLVEAKTAGRSIPNDVAYDSQGDFTTDPGKALEGAILPFDGGYKGAGLSMIIETLTGPLVAASFVGIGDVWGNLGNLAFAIDPELLVDRGEFKDSVSALVEKVKNTKKLPGVDVVYVPGERGDKLTQRVLESGEIEVEDNLYAELKRVVGEL